MVVAGVGDYEVTEAEDVPRGCTVVIHLREDCKEFADAAHVKNVIKKYASYFPHGCFFETRRNEEKKPKKQSRC